MSAETLIRRIGCISNRAKMESLVQVGLLHSALASLIQPNKLASIAPEHLHAQQVLHDVALPDLAAARVEAEQKLARM